MQRTKQEYKQKNLQRWKDKFGCSKTNGMLEVFLSSYSNRELAKPFAVTDILNGIGKDTIMARYGLTEWDHRVIKTEIGLYKKRVYATASQAFE